MPAPDRASTPEERAVVEALTDSQRAALLALPPDGTPLYGAPWTVANQMRVLRGIGLVMFSERPHPKNRQQAQRIYRLTIAGHYARRVAAELAPGEEG